MTRIKYGYSREVRVTCLGEREYPTDPVTCPEQVTRYWWDCITKASWYDREKEMFVVIPVNRKSHAIGFALVSLGSATSCLAHPREVYRPAVAMGAVGVVVCHNHPGGDPLPSSADLVITRKLRLASAALDIDLLDHVIIGAYGGRKHYSFRAAGVLGADLQIEPKAPVRRRAAA
jgi:DNA repair protein RadC